MQGDGSDFARPLRRKPHRRVCGSASLRLTNFIYAACKLEIASGFMQAAGGSSGAR
jgi:hypothetical protein